MNTSQCWMCGQTSANFKIQLREMMYGGFSREMLKLTVFLSMLIFGSPRAASGRCRSKADTLHADAIAPTHAELQGYLTPKFRACANASRNS